MTLTSPAHPLDGLSLRHLAPPMAVLAIAAITVGMSGHADLLAGWNVPAGLLSAAILLAWLPVAALAARGSRAGWTVICVVGVLLALNLFILTLPRIGPFAGLAWNWQGKTLDLIWIAALLVLLSSNQRREIGWTLRTVPGSLPVAFINIAILLAIGFLFAGMLPGSRALTLEQVLYDFSYPNLVEEVVFRGFMLALLDRAFPPQWRFGGARIGWGVVLTAWLFGLGHGITLDGAGALAFDAPWLLMTVAAGFVFGWLRALTGSLWPAFLAHCAIEGGILLALWLT